jgi:biotin-dependent carboxylase-like uncharacterized protein
MARHVSSSSRRSSARSSSAPGPSGRRPASRGPSGPTTGQDLFLDPPLALHPVGERGILADYPSTAHVLAAAEAIRSLRPDHLIDVVPAERTVLLLGAEGTDRGDLADLLSQLPPAATAGRPTREVTIDAIFDGEDLEDVASGLGLSTDGLVDAHTATRWTAAFGGFAPGFSYLLPTTDVPGADDGGTDPTGSPAPDASASPATSGAQPWDVPRRPSPRTRVPRGSIALASRYCGVYPTSSPGGWQLIGHTDATLWDAGATEPALVTPGSVVRFRAVRATARTSARVRTTGPRSTATARESPSRRAGTSSRTERSGPHDSAAPGTVGGSPALTMLSPGPSTVIEDGGRPGHAALGVSTSGAADRSGMVRANLSVGNCPHAPILEILLGPVRARAQRDLVLALDDGSRGPAGAAPPVVVRGAADGIERAYPVGVPFPVAAGDTLTIGPAGPAVRLSLALRGGVTGPGVVMGSWSRDLLGGLGPEPLAEGAVVHAGPTDGLAAIAADVSHAPAAGPLPPHDRGAPSHSVPHGAAPSGDDQEGSTTVLLPLVAGPRDDLLGAKTMEALVGTTWTVRHDSDRVGVRLDGPALPVPEGAGSLPSEPMLPGAVQIPPSGLPVVFGRDHPTTGGYPVIGVVTDAGLDLLAHVAPERTVRFVLVG